VTNGGFEYPLTIIALTVAVTLVGPGRYELDRYLGVTLPLVHLLVAGLLIALAVAAIVAKPRPALRTDMRRTA
jgi:hypothetical protein